MQPSKIDERLRRLVKSDVCNADNARQYKDELMELADSVATPEELRRRSRYFKALSDEKRLRILKLLGIRDMCVCELSIALNVSQPNLSHHLKILENEMIVERMKRGKWVYYSLRDDVVLQILKSVS
jgi:ArsR family transcriptional regulator